MRRKQNIQDTFKSVVPELSAGPWSVGYSGHTDDSATLSTFGNSIGVSGVTLVVNSITNITDQYVPGTSNLVMNDVYVYYSEMSGSTVMGTGKTSIYSYATTTTAAPTTTTAAPTTTTTAAPTTTTTAAPTTTTTTT